METKEPDRSFPPSTACTHEHEETTEAQPFAGMKMPWAEFYCCQTRRLFRIAAKTALPPDQIEDVLQEVWLDALKHSEGFQGEDVERRLSAWLGTVVVHKSMDTCRRNGRRRTESLDELHTEPMDGKAKEPEVRMEATESVESLAAVLEKLRQKNPLNCRLVCEHLLERRSLKDLAAETGLGIHAISCRIDRGLRELRGLLPEHRPANKTEGRSVPMVR